MRHKEKRHKNGTDPQILLSIEEVALQEGRNKGVTESEYKGRCNEGEVETKT